MRDPADQLIEARNPPVVPHAVARGHRKIVLTRHKARSSAVAVPHPRTATPPRTQTTAVVLVGWRLRFRPSEQARAWQRGAHGEQQTARLLDRLGRDGYQVLHDLAIPGSPANIDHLVIGPSGLVGIGSKQWTGQVHQGSDGLLWHNSYRLDRTLATIRWQGQGHAGREPAATAARRTRPVRA